MGNARSDKHISRLNSKSAYTPAPKNKDEDTKFNIGLICFLTFLIIGSIMSFFLKERLFWFWVIFCCACMFVDANFLKPIVKNVIAPYIVYVSDLLTPNKEAKKPAKLKNALLRIVAIEVILLSMLNPANAISLVKDIPENLGFETKEKNDIKYNFSIVLNEDFNIYFDKEDDAKSFANTLETSFTAIEKIKSIPDKEVLESPNDYGINAKTADAHEREFHSMWEDNKDHIKECPLALNYCEVIIDLREKMDSAYETPENRRQLVDAYFRKGRITGDKFCFERAVRYAFASFYTELTWGNYSEYYIDKIIEMYQHLDGAENEHEDNIETIIDALTRLKDVFKRNPPGNVISVLDRYK